MLTCHPEVSIPPESPFITRLYPKWGLVHVQTREEIQKLRDDLFSCDKKFRDWGLSPGHVSAKLETILPFNFRQFVDAIYSLYLKQVNKESARWGDKNPLHLNYIGLLMDLFPKGKFVHIVRDGRAVLNSFINSNRKAGKIYPNTPCEAAKYWIAALGASYPFRNHRQYFELCYENLLTRPKEELRRVCEFLQISYLPAEMLSYPIVNKAQRLVPKHRLPWHEATLRAVDTTKILSWRCELRRRHILLFELCAGWEIAEYGYDLILPFARWRILNQVSRRIHGRMGVAKIDP